MSDMCGEVLEVDKSLSAHTDKKKRLSLSVFRIDLLSIAAVVSSQLFCYTTDDRFSGSLCQASRQKYYPLATSTTSWFLLPAPGIPFVTV